MVGGFEMLADLPLPVLVPVPGTVRALLPVPVGASRFVIRATREQWGWRAPGRGIEVVGLSALSHRPGVGVQIDVRQPQGPMSLPPREEMP